MRIVMLATLLSCLSLRPDAAEAAAISFSGSGTLTSAPGALRPTEVTPIGSSFSFGFSFDPASATPRAVQDRFAAYAVSVSDFSATIGSYAFPLDPARRAVIQLQRVFTVFDPALPATEPALNISFFLFGPPDAGAAQTPFGLPDGSVGTLSIGYTFRNAESTPLSLADLAAPVGAPIRRFSYSETDPATRWGGNIFGSFAGGFAAVPEPATWITMILGVGLVGAGLRRKDAIRLASA